MPKILPVRPLRQETFAPFGHVIEADPARMRLINGGNTERFRGQPRAFPYQLTMMERHPFGSQSFSPLNGRPYLVVVSEDDGGRPAEPQVFLAGGEQGVNYRRNVWHHPLMTLDAPSDFLVVDRDGPGNNLEEFFFDDPFLISAPLISE